MRIKMKCLVKHGRDRFEAEDERTVDDDTGAYFVKNGWASEIGAPEAAADPAPTNVTLDVYGGSHGVKDSNHG